MSTEKEKNAAEAASKRSQGKKKKGESLVGKFFAVFLRAIVIILAMVIAVLGFILVRQIVNNNRMKQEAVSEDVDRDELITATYTEEWQTATEAQQEEAVGNVNYDIPIVVLNGTDTAGLAAAWMDELKSKGYTVVSTGNYFDGSDSTRILIKEGDAGAELVQYFDDARLESGTPDQESTDAVIDDYAVFIIIGPDNVI